MSATAATLLKHPEFRGRIGVARADITPPVGIYSRTWGSAQHDQAEGVHRPLLGSCLVLQDNSHSEELIFFALDMVVLDPKEVADLRATLQKRCGLRPEQLMIHPSHSHSTPWLRRRLKDRPGGHLIEPYLDTLPDICEKLIADARAAASPAILSWAYGRCGLAYNRDFIDPASGRDVCGLNTAEKADDTLLVGRVTDDKGKIVATLVNYACHPVSLGGGNRLMSPDYIGAMREVVERETGGAVCLFLHGASGDLTPRRSYEPVPEAADQNGRELGYAAMATLSGMFPPGQQFQYQGIEESGTPLGVWRLIKKPEVNDTLSGRMINTRLPLIALPSRDELETQLAAATERYAIERLERSIARRILVGDGSDSEFFFTVWRLGDAFLIATPAEAYSKFQVDLREIFRDTAVAVLNATDGSNSYLPLPESFNRDVYQSRIALYSPNSLQRVTEMAAETAADMR
jgi:Neutral/alkaline non-lysosomal ceramidase, N-terminal